MASTPFTGSTLSRSPASTKGHLVDGMLSSTTPSPRGVSPAREKSVYFSDGMMKQSPITPRRPDMSPIPRSHATPSKTQPLPNKPSGLPPLVESEVLALIENLRHKLLRACDELATLKVLEAKHQPESKEWQLLIARQRQQAQSDEATITELKNQVKELTTELQRIKADVVEKQEKRGNEADGEKGRFEEVIEKQKSKIAEVTAKLLQVESEQREVSEAKRYWEANCGELQKKIDALTKQVTEQVAETETLRLTRRQFEEAVSSVEQKITEVLATQCGLEATIVEEKQRATLLEKQVTGMSKERAILRQRTAEYASLLQVKDDEILRLTDERTRLEAEMLEAVQARVMLLRLKRGEEELMCKMKEGIGNQTQMRDDEGKDSPGDESIEVMVEQTDKVEQEGMWNEGTSEQGITHTQPEDRKTDANGVDMDDEEVLGEGQCGIGLCPGNAPKKRQREDINTENVDKRETDDKVKVIREGGEDEAESSSKRRRMVVNDE